MATNPKIPPRRGPTTDRKPVVISRRGNTWWPPLLAIVVVVIIGLLIWWLSRSPNRNAAATSVTGNGVQLTNLAATTPTVNGAFIVTGTLVNNGSAAVRGVKVEGTFKNIQGQTAEKISADVEPAQAVQTPAGAPEGSGVATGSGVNPAQTHGFVKPGGGVGSLTKTPDHQNGPGQPGFASHPIEPGQSVPIAIPFMHVPSGWVGGVPQLRISNVETAQQNTNGSTQ